MPCLYYENSLNYSARGKIMPHKPIEIVYTDSKGTEHLVWATHYSPTIKHAVQKYIDVLNTNEQLYKDECMNVGEPIVNKRLAGRYKCKTNLKKKK